MELKALETTILKLSSPREEMFLDRGRALRDLKAKFKEDYHRVVQTAGLSTRKAYYLINLAEQLQVTPGFRKRLHDLGWTKSKIIGKHRAGHNFVKLIEFAEAHTTKELEAYVAKKEHSVTRCVLLYFTPAQYRRYEEAVLKFGAKQRGRGLTDKESATIRMAKKALSI